MNKIQKIIFTLIYTLFVTAAGFAGTKTWVGGDSDKPTDWDTAANWSPSGVPTSSDEVVINSGGNQPVIENKTFYMYQTTKSINIKKLTIEDGAELTIVSKKHNVKLSCTYGIINDGTLILDLRNYSKKIAFTKTEFKDQAEIYIKAPFTLPNTYTVKFASNTQIDFKEGSLLTAENGHNNDSLEIDTPTLNFKGDFSSKRNLEIKNSYGGNLNIDIKGSLRARAGVSILDNANTNITSSGTVNLMKPFTLTSANWNAGGGTIETYGSFTVPKFEQTGGTLRLQGSLAQYLNIKQAYKLEIGSSCSLSLTGNIKISNSLTNNGTFFNAGNKTVTLNPPANGTVTITGTSTATNTRFYDLEFTNGGGKTLTIKKEIFINHSLTLEGTDINNLLTIAGGWENPAIKLQNSMSGGKWLNVKTNIPIESPNKYTTTDSKPDGPKEDLDAGKPSNWIFSSPAALIWTGKNSNDWNTASNWAPRTAPSSSTNVIIPRDCYRPPELGSDTYNAKHVTVESGAELNLKGTIIEQKSLENYGTVYMEGSADQKTWLERTLRPIFDHKDGSKIVYQKVTAPNEEIWQGPYKKLEFKSDVPDTIKAASLEVKEQLTVNKSITLDTGSGNQTYDDTINAGGYDITLKGSAINTKGDISANKITVTGDWNSNNGNITVATSIAAAKWNSERGTITAGTDITVTGNWYSERSSIKGRNITSSGSKWTSWGGIEASGNIDIVNELAFTGGHIKVGGNLTAKKLNTSSDSNNGGLILFSGSGPQKLSGKDGNNIIDGKIQNLRINSGTTLQLESDITITVGLNNQGVFDAATKSKKVTLEHKISEIKIEGNIADNNTKFHELICSGAGGKTLTIDDNITVTKLSLSGTSRTNRLEISTTTGTEDSPVKISLGSPHNTLDPLRKFLKINTLGLKIITTPPYVVDESVDYNDIPQSANGWVFVKPSLTIKNSFAKPGDNHIYLLFNVNTEYLSLEEFKALGGGWLKITNGSSPLYTSTIADAEISGGTWKIPLDNPVSADHILDPSCKVTLTYFNDPPTDKTYISDIGIDMVKPLKAFNSIVLYDFGAESDDPSLVTLDVTIPSVIAGSDDVKLYFISKDSPVGSFWYPNPPLSSVPGNLSFFASSQSGTHEYSPLPDGGANQIKFIIPSTDSYLVKDKVGQFMFVYKGWLPCARLKDPNNILSFDVWNFKIAGVQKQKGGVSVFNNVINPNKNQEATIGAHLKKSGMLTIQIMTLDGNVVRTLERSHKDAGDHFVNWDGRNNGGNPVASGMYFVRIAGPEIDEVRKILVIK